uniref:G_PROTEIN_RECEP_F1_2 domain-containing protein n=1 Tax=Steinernema glaseri TaxID=37863 RepID=A0A1I7ZP83_9BILA
MDVAARSLTSVTELPGPEPGPESGLARLLWTFGPAIFSVIGVGNVLVFLAIGTDRRLQNKTNFSLFSLAIADLLVCVFVMPLWMVTHGRYGAGYVGYKICFTYVYADVFLCTASIVHMSMISLDRYVGLSRPFMKSRKSWKAIVVQIASIWLLTTVITSPLAILAYLDEANVFDDEAQACGVFNRGFMLYGSLISFVPSLFLSVFTYVQTCKILNDKASLSSQNGHDYFANGLRRSRPPTRKNTHGSRYSYNGVAVHKASSFSYTSLGTPHALSRKPTCVSAFSAGQLESALREESKKPSPLRAKIDRLRDRTSSVLTIISAKMGRKGSVHSRGSEKLASERKATRVLAVVFCTFLVCWCPFFANNIIYAVCAERCAIPEFVSTLFLWLGYVSSTMNPLIYTLFNRRWRVAFRRILLGQCLRKDPRSMNYSRNQTFVPPETYTWSNFDRPLAAKENGVASRTEVFRRENSVDSSRGSGGPARRLQRHPTLAYRQNSESSGMGDHPRRPPRHVSLAEAQKPSVSSDKPLLAPSDEDESAEERGPATKRAAERGPATKSPEKTGPVKSTLEERGPTTTAEETFPKPSVLPRSVSGLPSRPPTTVPKSRSSDDRLGLQKETFL